MNLGVPAPRNPLNTVTGNRFVTEELDVCAHKRFKLKRGIEGTRKDDARVIRNASNVLIIIL